jgi:hypothetical protein
VAGTRHRTDAPTTVAATRRSTWWMAALFAVGSSLFALGAFPAYADHVDPRAVGLTFFVGSVLFTAAGALQYVQTAPTTPAATTDPPSPHLPRVEWWAAVVQLGGMVLFNVSTASAMISRFSIAQQERLVWAPDMGGSIAFMVASTLAWLVACHGWWAWRPHDDDWRVAALNLLGSVAFQVSAVAAFIRPATGEVLNLPVANLGTFVGAVCFLLGAWRLVPAVRVPAPAAA